MAKIPRLKRIVTEDFPSEKSWIGKLLSPLNDFMESVTAALSKRLTFGENMACQIFELTFDGRFPAKVSWNAQGRPLGVLLLEVRRKSDGAPPAGAVSLPWTFNQAREVEIPSLPGVTPTNAEPWVVKFVVVEG